jgi:hypothetical protein
LIRFTNVVFCLSAIATPKRICGRRRYETSVLDRLALIIFAKKGGISAEGDSYPQQQEFNWHITPATLAPDGRGKENVPRIDHYSSARRKGSA